MIINIYEIFQCTFSIDKLPALSPECTFSNLMIMCLQTGFKFFCGSLFSLFWGTSFIRTNSSQQGDQKGLSCVDSCLIPYRIKRVYPYRDCRLRWSVCPIAYPARTVIVVSDGPPVVKGWEHKPLCRWNTTFTGIKWLACAPQLIGSKSQISSQTHTDSPAPLQALEATGLECSFCSCAKGWDSRIRSHEDVK